MNAQELFDNIKRKSSFLCVGLDPDMQKLPPFLHDMDDPIFEFNKTIIDATASKVIAYKPNVAFYEALGLYGIRSLEKTCNYIKEKYPDQFLILDAKRGDIGNTSDMYATSAFKHFNADAVTVNPYMGEDSVKPFMEHSGKWVILLALTSNPGSADFEQLIVKSEEGEIPLYQKVIKTSSTWSEDNNLMYVVGATKAFEIEKIRKIIPNNFLLVPGVGAQGGSLEDVAEKGLNEQCGLIINASRSIIFADKSELFGVKAAEEAESLRLKMEEILIKHGLI